jgi:hypothetical protein
MKLVSLVLHQRLSSKERKMFITTPYLSIRSLNYHPPHDTLIYIKFVTFLFLTAFWVVLADQFLSPLNYLEVLIFSPALYFFTETLGGFGQTLFFKRRIFPIHRRPLGAASLSNFWGRKWNVWVQDWLRDVTDRIDKRKHYKRIIAVFFLSGLFHELMVNLPYWVLYKKSYFGTMLAYFLIQAVALWIDKKFLSKGPAFMRRLYLWCAVILPSPLFINVPLLTFFGLSHE